MKGMKIVFGLVVISVMAMSLGSANAALFETDFESYTPSTQVAGQDGWIKYDGTAAVNAYIDSSSTPHEYMRDSQWLAVTGVGDVTRHANALYRPFAAQTGQVRMEVLYWSYFSETAWRSVSLRDSSDAEQAAVAALVGSCKHYGEGTPEDPRAPFFFASDAEGRQWDFSYQMSKDNHYKIVIDANVGTQTYDAAVYLYDNSTGVVGAQVVSWSGLSFASTVSDISRVYVSSWDNLSLWDNFNITPEPATLAVLALGGFAVLLRRKR